MATNHFYHHVDIVADSGGDGEGAVGGEAGFDGGLDGEPVAESENAKRAAGGDAPKPTS